jgi:hypothetical protein
VGIISTILEVVDISKELLSAGTDSYSAVDAISQALERKRQNAPDLLSNCLTTAIKRNIWNLNSELDPQELQIDSTSLRKKLANLEVAQANTPTDQIVAQIANAVEEVVSLQNNQTAVVLDRTALIKAIESAFEDFFVRLPKFPVASTQVTNNSLRTLSQKLEDLQLRVSQTSSYLDPTRIQQESSRVEYRNPFRIVKAEEFDHDYQRLAQLFRAPMEYDRIRGPGNVILQGGRGCGKSMILRSLCLPAAIRLRQLQNLDAQPLVQFEESGLEYVGVYLKLARGYFYNWTPDCKLTIDAATHLSQHTLNMVLLSAAIETLQDARSKGLLPIPADVEQRITEGIGQVLGSDLENGGFPKLQNVLLEEQRLVGNYVGELRLGIAAPDYAGKHTSIHDYLRILSRQFGIVDSIFF